MSIQKKSKTDLRKHVLIRNFQKLEMERQIQEIDRIIARTRISIEENSLFPELFFTNTEATNETSVYYIE